MRAKAAAAPKARAAETELEQRLAGIHLRLGSLLLARAELEQLAVADALDVAALADLAEVRWRMGDLDAAATAAAAHLAAGGTEPIVHVVAAEAAAASGRPGEARAQVAAVGGIAADEIERHFAGMPRRAFWPSAPAGPVEAIEAFGAGREARPATRAAAQGTSPQRSNETPTDGDGPGLWPEEAPAIGSPAAGSPLADASRSTAPADLLEVGRADVRAGNPERVAAGLDRLALALRMDPMLAPGVLEALGRHREPAALVIRGDAFRILGRVLEAEAAYLAAAAALEGLPRRGRA